MRARCRPANSVAYVKAILVVTAGKGATLRIADLGVDTSIPTSKLMLVVLGGIAQFAREMMLERQREGIARAKSDGRYRGRKPTARTKAAEIQALRAVGLSMISIT